MRCSTGKMIRGTVPLLVALLGGCSIIPPQRGDSEFRPAYPPTPPSQSRVNGAIYQSGYGLMLFEDLTAKRVGDILTVVLTEQTDAKKSATTSTDRDTQIEMPNPVLFGRVPEIGGRDIFNNEVESATQFDGEGDSAQSNQLAGTISVTVVDVLANGNLVIQGEKWIGINQGEEYIRLRGMVRPVDVRADNSVLSTQIANAEILYGGTGAVADTNRPGWLTRFFSSIIWPL